MKRTYLFAICILLIPILTGCDLFSSLGGGKDEDYYFVSGYVTEYNSNPTEYLASVTYMVREGSNTKEGPTLVFGNTENATVPASRSFQTILPPGVYTIEFTKTGYHTAYLTNLVVDDSIDDAHMMLKPNNVHYTPTTVLDGYEYGNATSLSAYND